MGLPKPTGTDSLPETLNLPTFAWREAELQLSAILQILHKGMGYANYEASLVAGKGYGIAAQ
jgi:hypothetical protein